MQYIGIHNTRITLYSLTQSLVRLEVRNSFLIALSPMQERMSSLTLESPILAFVFTWVYIFQPTLSCVSMMNQGTGWKVRR